MPRLRQYKIDPKIKIYTKLAESNLMQKQQSNLLDRFVQKKFTRETLLLNPQVLVSQEISRVHKSSPMDALKKTIMVLIRSMPNNIACNSWTFNPELV